MNIKVLGAGCQNCKNLHKMVGHVLESEGIEAELEYITDMTVIPQYVMNTPGLVIDGKVVHQGKPIPEPEKVRELILGAAG